MGGREMSRAAVAVAGAIAAIGLGGAAGVAGQARRTPATLDHVLEELQGLRADLQVSSSANLRVQALVARVTLQEQRLKALSEQLNAARSQMDAIDDDRREAERHLRDIENAVPNPGVSASDVRAMLEEQRRRIETLRDRHEQTRLRADELSGLVQAEQDRWVDFNGRLDALEQALARAR